MGARFPQKSSFFAPTQQDLYNGHAGRQRRRCHLSPKTGHFEEAKVRRIRSSVLKREDGHGESTWNGGAAHNSGSGAAGMQEAAGNHLNHAEFLELALQDELVVRSERLIGRRVREP